MVLYYLSLPAAYEVIEHVPLFFALVFNVLACINVSSPPHRLLIYESYPGLSLQPPEESTDVESVTRRIASHPQKS